MTTQKVKAEEDKLSQRKLKIDDEMMTIEPLLAAAKKAVGGISTKSLDEIRGFRAPPTAIHHILQGVLILMGIQDTSWGNMRNFLGQRGVKDDIINFDARSASSACRTRVQEVTTEFCV